MKELTPEQQFVLMVERIHMAIESEQVEPSEFNDETDMRLELVYRNLREILNLAEDFSGQDIA